MSINRQWWAAVHEKLGCCRKSNNRFFLGLVAKNVERGTLTSMKNNGPYSFAIALGAEHILGAERIPAGASVQQIVAAQVPGKVSFDGVEITNAEPLQLYTRTADRIEAATRIATGQHLDIQA